MKQFYPFISFLIIVLASCADHNISIPMTEYNYPEVFRDSSIVEDYHGTKIADPYRWLEDDTSTETESWVDAQNKLTFTYLDQIPFRNQVRERLEELWDYEKYGSPIKNAGVYYFFKNDGLQNQSVLYRDNGDGTNEVILDPNEFSEDGTTSLAALDFSANGKYLAYYISESGSDWRKARVMNLEDLSMLDDELEWIKFSGVSWWKDGFFYSRFPEPKEGDELSAKNEYHSLYYHQLGNPQENDELVYGNPDHPKRNVYASTTDDERFLVLTEAETTSGNSLIVKDLSQPDSDFTVVIDDFDYDYYTIDNVDNELIIMTNEGAAKQQIIAIDVSTKARRVLIPEADDVIQSVSLAGDKLFVEYLHNAASQLRVFDLEGNHIKDIDFHIPGNISGIRGKKGEKEAFLSFTSYTSPSTIYSLDTETLNYSVFQKPDVNFNFDDYVTSQQWFESYDGTRVPMFITHHKELVKDGTNPTLLYGYGGFNISLTPGFSPTILPILENGGIYAVVNLRGGGEFGKEWHEAGTKERKQNVFDDFQSAAEYLIEQKYTSSEKLAIRGGSNGGLLIGACMTQRPDLYRVAFPAIGVLDMLRYHQFTIGRAWTSDYGSSDDAEAFDYLIKYSPLHNINAADYPATLITTADHDDRVVPAHSFKFASELQHRHTGSAPVMIRVEKSAGHGAGKPTNKILDEYADLWSFMYYNMDEKMQFPVKD